MLAELVRELVDYEASLSTIPVSLTAPRRNSWTWASLAPLADRRSGIWGGGEVNLPMVYEHASGGGQKVAGSLFPRQFLPEIEVVVWIVAKPCHRLVYLRCKKL